MPPTPPPAPPDAPSAHGGLAPSPWVLRWAARLPAGARVLDLACGSGRHLRALQGRGLHLTGVDRDAAALADLAALQAPGEPGMDLLQADLEAGPWPLAGRRFDLVVVTNYLWRPRWPELLATLAPGGCWVHETFAAGHATVGRPSRPDFLLQPGELLDVARGAGLRIVAYEDGFLAGPPPRFVQRIAAHRPRHPAPAEPERLPLD